MPPKKLDIEFLVTTQEDKGDLGRHIQAINSHSATIKHQHRQSFSTVETPEQTKSEATQSSRQPPRRRSSRRDGGHVERRTARGGATKTLASPGVEHTDQIFSFDRLLQTTLDPFVKLPIEVSSYERGLLHTWLTSGGRRVAPISQHVFSPAIYAASRLIMADDMWTLTHIAMGEWTSCQKRGTELTSLYYQRRGQAFRYMAKLMSEDQSRLRQISGLSQLALMDNLFGRGPPSAHLKAMHHLLDLEDAFREPTLLWNGQGPKVGLGFLTPFFLFAEIPIPDQQAFDAILDRFSRNVVTLTARRCAVLPDTAEDEDLLRMRKYVSWVIAAHLVPTEAQGRKQAGALAFAFILAMSHEAYDLSSTASKDLLLTFSQSLTPTINTFPLDCGPVLQFDGNPSSRLWLLWNARELALRVSDKSESIISRNLLDVLRLLPYMSLSDMYRLAQSYAGVALSAISPPDELAEVLPTEELDAITDRLRERWSLRNADALADVGEDTAG